MPLTNAQPRRVLHQRTATRIVAFYALFSSLWIYSSDSLLAWLFHDPAQLTQAQTVKGGLFVVVTALLLYLYLSHCLRTLRTREETLEAEKLKGQKDIQERFSQLSTLFDAMNAVVYVADFESYELLYVNHFAIEHFGPDWQGQKCYHYLQEGIEHPCAFCTNPQLIKSGKSGSPVAWEFLNTRNNRWYECFDKTIRWTDGRLVRLEIALDVTERKELEKIKDDLLSSMSHEMRTPLTAINGFAELLMNEPELLEQHRAHIGIIYQESEKLTELINNFLEVRRLKINRARVDYELLPILKLLNMAMTACRDRKEHHEILIECHPELQLYGNRQELTQVVTQLLANACRYSPKGGEISLSATTAGQDIRIKITDHGIGIAKHELESIFDPFYRLDTGNSRKTGGIGLGLCLAKEIVSLHGGKIQVESTPGEGSTFSILLPQPPTNESLHVNSSGDYKR